jgi:hypothetical protein
MPGGTVPPDPYNDPTGYLIWLFRAIERSAFAGDMVGVNATLDGQREAVEKLEAKR